MRGGVGGALDVGQCGWSRQGKFHDEAARAKITPEMLSEHAFNIRFVIHDENAGTQFEPPAIFCDINVRGSVTINSVKIPGSVSTLIVPPCCFTTMSWLIDKPSPVPSPAGLVVKKGLNIFSFTSVAIPMPLSRMRISILLPKFFVVARSVGWNPSAVPRARLVAA